MKDIELSPIKETGNDFDELEERIKKAFAQFLYLPLLKTLSIDSEKLTNAEEDALRKALASGKVVYWNESFSGQFNASISRRLKELGAVWDKKTSTFKLAFSSISQKDQQMIRASAQRHRDRMNRVGKKFTQKLPAEIAGKIKSFDVFEKALSKTSEKVAKSLKGITIVPKLTSEDRKKIADEWQNNMDLWIKNFAEEEIPRLRKQIEVHALKGGRYQDLVKVIQDSYGVTSRKAKFLARQETNLLMTKFKETRYVGAGVTQYKWGCVIGTPKHPVRPDHKRLAGKIFRWDDPPVTDLKTGAKNNPGQDYNCRCFAKPIVRFVK